MVGGCAEFPPFTSERIYMQPFYKAHEDILIPREYSRWVPFLRTMLSTIQTDERMFLMVDQAALKQGSSHRRPGPHIDGNWVENLKAEHATRKNLYPETLLLCLDMEGCVGYSGPWTGTIGKGGDVSHLNLTDLVKVRIPPNVVYAMNVYGIHESVPVKKSGARTLVRVNVPHHVLK